MAARLLAMDLQQRVDEIGARSIRDELAADESAAVTEQRRARARAAAQAVEPSQGIDDPGAEAGELGSDLRDVWRGLAGGVPMQ
jgi:hypothetical protein